MSWTRAGLAGLLIALVLAVAGASVATAAGFEVDGPVSVGPFGGDGAFPAASIGMSDDGDVVAFATAEELVHTDDDGAVDIYARRGDTDSVLLTPRAPVTPSNYVLNGTAVLPNGDVLITTESPIAPTDGDQSSTDVFLFGRDGRVRQLSDVPGDPVRSSDPDVDVTSVAVSADGTTVAFSTAEYLVPSDGDGVTDVHVFRNGVLLLATPSAHKGDVVGLSADGSRAFWESDGQGPGFPDDDSGEVDVFSGPSAGGAVTSPTYGRARGAAAPAHFVAASPDGDTIVVRTAESLVSRDDDGRTPDLYVFRGNDEPQLVSAPEPGADGYGNDGDAAVERACDGGVVLFSSSQRLTPDDTDSAGDIYAATSGGLRLATRGSGTGSGTVQAYATSEDCTDLAWISGQQETPDDTGQDVDLFASVDGGAPRRVTMGSGPRLREIVPSSAFTGTSTFGAALYVTTNLRLEASDADDELDVYRWDPATGRSTLVSSAAPAAGAVSGQVLAAVNPAGDRVLVATEERLGSSDVDAVTDLYRYRLPSTAPPPDAPLTSPAPRVPPSVAGPPGSEVSRRGDGAFRPSILLGARTASLRIRSRTATILTSAAARCPVGALPCTTVLTATTRRGDTSVSLGSVTRRLAAGAQVRIELPLGPRGRARLRAAGRRSVRFAMSVRRGDASPVHRSYSAVVTHRR